LFKKDVNLMQRDEFEESFLELILWGEGEDEKRL